MQDIYEQKTGDPYGNRTHDYGVRGRRLNRLTKGPSLKMKRGPGARPAWHTPCFPSSQPPSHPSKRAGAYLSSQVVTNQVFSAQPSLTSVFGMGTGGTLASSAPAIYSKVFYRATLY